MKRGALCVPGPGVRDHRIGQVFEPRALADPENRGVFRIARAGAMAIQTRGAGGGDLRLRSGLERDFQREAVAGQHAAGDIVQMNQRSAPRLREGPDHLPRRILLKHVKPGPLKLQPQLMNSRVPRDPCRIDANSGYGLKHQTSSHRAAAAIAGFRFQSILAAADWPRGIKRWQAETSPATD